MPWEQHWVPAPKDESLTVLAEVPGGLQDWGGVVSGVIDGQYLTYHHCRRCGGWIPGRRYESRVDTLGPLCGRRGTEFFCARCGEEIGFTGIVS